MKPIILLLALTMAAFARIGETPAECEARYGKPVEAKAMFSTYDKNGIKFRITFSEGRAVSLDFDHNVTDAQWEALKTANGGTAKWGAMELIDESMVWRTDDGKLIARASVKDGYVIWSVEFLTKFNEFQKSEEVKTVEGF